MPTRSRPQLTYCAEASREPCQDLSLGTVDRSGLGGTRSGLWSEFARLIGEIRPKYVVVENVAALQNFGLLEILAELTALGYDAEWDCLPAAAFGAPHRRDRIWIVAYPGAREGDAPDPAVARPQGVAGDWLERERRKKILTSGLGQGELRSWPDEPDLPRVAHGLSDRVDRVRTLGNALVPKIPEWIGNRILKFETG